MKRTSKGPRQTPVELRMPLPPELQPYQVKAYRMGECSIIVGHEPKGFQTSRVDRPGTPPKRWHLSIAHPSRYPTWDEIADAREALLPKDLVFAQILPGDWDEYVNKHPNCFHLWEVRDEAG